MSDLYNAGPATTNTATSNTAVAPVAAPATPPTDQKVLLQITESKSMNLFSGNKNPSYNVNVLSYYDGTELKNTTTKSDVENLLTDTKNNILLIENNKSPVQIQKIDKISGDAFRKFKFNQQQSEPDSTQISNFNNPSSKDKLLGFFGKSEKIAVTIGGKTKTKRKRLSHKKSARRNLTRRS